MTPEPTRTSPPDGKMFFDEDDLLALSGGMAAGTIAGVAVGLFAVMPMSVPVGLGAVGAIAGAVLKRVLDRSSTPNRRGRR